MCSVGVFCRQVSIRRNKLKLEKLITYTIMLKLVYGLELDAGPDEGWNVDG